LNCFHFVNLYNYADVIASHAVPLCTESLPNVVSNTTKPANGVEIAFFWVVVTLGNKTPCVVLLISKLAQTL
jgi:hypothetical protein